MLVRSAECYQVAKAHAHRTAGKEYDWYMHGRPDMAWFEDAVMPSSLQPDAVSLRAREVWGHKSVPAALFRLTDNQLSYNWGTRSSCGTTACPMLAAPRAPCLLADDQWAWIPKRYASAYYTANAGCALDDATPATARWGSHAMGARTARSVEGLLSSDRKVVSRRLMALAPSGRPPAWQMSPLKMVYNGEGLLTARLLQLRVPMHVVPAALRFHPTKKGANWKALGGMPRPCVGAPCKDANAISHACTPGHIIDAFTISGTRGIEAQTSDTAPVAKPRGAFKVASKALSSLPEPSDRSQWPAARQRATAMVPRDPKLAASHDPDLTTMNVSAGALLGGLLGVCVLFAAMLHTLQSCVNASQLGAYSLSVGGRQVASFLALVIVQSMAILLFKLVQVQHAYTFSPASSVALTELLKLALAACLHARYMRSEPGRTWAQGISCRIIIHYVGLATVYTVNNQLTFAILAIVDPGTFSLGKSVSPYLVAIILRTLGQQLNSLQWICIFVQCCAIAITQYDNCTSKAFLSSKAYLLMVASAFLTASASVWNQKVLQGCDVPLNLQNSIMYLAGFMIACISFVCTANSPGTKGFLEGYSMLSILLIVSQAFTGLAVTLVYKYADAIIKNFASACVTAILIFISAYFFGQGATFTSWLAVAIVLAATWTYMTIAIRLNDK